MSDVRGAKEGVSSLALTEVGQANGFPLLNPPQVPGGTAERRMRPYPPHLWKAAGFGQTDLVHATLTAFCSAGSVLFPSDQPCAAPNGFDIHCIWKKEQQGNEVLQSSKVQQQRLNTINGITFQSHQLEQLELKQQGKQHTHKRKSGAFSYLPAICWLHQATSSSWKRRGLHKALTLL